MVSEKKNTASVSLQKSLMSGLFCFFNVLMILVLSQSEAFADREEVISLNNEFGGKTVEVTKNDFSILYLYYDDDGNIAKEETIYPDDYPIDNKLKKIIITKQFEKKLTEEKIFSDTFSSQTLIQKSIVHFDRNTGERVKEENHFVPPFSSYNVIYRENDKKTKIEWHYPENVDGIAKNIVHFGNDGIATKTESYFTEKTIRELGHYKRIYFTSFGANRYLRKNRQVWFYTEDYAADNNGVAKKIEYFHYKQGRPVKVETLLFDINDQYLQR